MQTKVCSKCHQEKPITEYRKDKAGMYGVRGDCRVCSGKKEKANVDRKRQSDRKYKNSEKGKQKRKEYVENNTERLRELGRENYQRNHKKWKKNRDIDVHRLKIKEYGQKYPERRRARDAVLVAVRKGEMIPVTARVCSICQKQAHQYHHPSYDQSQWLVVVPLCRSCHLRIHRGNLTIPYPIISSLESSATT